MRMLVRITMLAASIAAVCALAADVSGAWKFEVQTDQGAGSPSFVFKQDGEKLTGTYTGLFGKANLAGTVKGDRIEFSFKVDAQGQDLVMTYSGTIEGPSRMKGKVDAGGFASGTWTALKQ